LERRTRSGGRDVIDHPVGGHDDLSNVLAGVCDATAQKVVIAGSGEPSNFGGTDSSTTGSDPYTAFTQSAAWQQRQELYQQEMRELSQHRDDGQDAWREIAERFGRGRGMYDF
jgi:hypothetical protein